jgi:hypothetical protein
MNNWKGTRGKWTSLTGQVMVKGEYHDENICRINKSTEAEINEALIIEAGNVRQQIDCSLHKLLEQRNELLKVLENIENLVVSTETSQHLKETIEEIIKNKLKK